MFCIPFSFWNNENDIQISAKNYIVGWKIDENVDMYRHVIFALALKLKDFSHP